ncbi:MAG: hypothetical protein VX938_09560, partial [Myxococcota bacterium]|nr:hypothetical protein [Myxococcota bacterium]
MKQLIRFVCVVALALGACSESGDAPASGPATGVLGDLPDTQQEPDVTAQPTGVATLAFIEDMGDDDLPCETTCALYLSYNEERTIQVLYTRGGQPVSGQVVKFALEGESPEGIGHISALSAYSDDSGIAAISVKPAQAVTGVFQVKAHVDEDDVQPLIYDVAVTPKKQVPLTVTTEYLGTRPVTNFEVRLYLQNEDGLPGCEDPNLLYTTQTAHQQSPPTTLGQSVKFLEFDGLEEAGTQVYTIMTYAQDPENSDVILAWGCNDERGVVTIDSSTSVRVPLLDRPPSYAGSYEVTTLLDASDALPEPYGGAINVLLDFFQSPSNTLLQLSCDLGGTVPVLGDLCGLVYTNEDAENLTSIGSVIIDILDSLVEDLAEGSVWGDILVAGADIAD